MAELAAGLAGPVQNPKDRNMNEIHHPSSNSAHTFFIPVMGTGFTVDSPLRVAKYGISSTISLVDDTLIEQMRRFHCERVGEPYEEISGNQDDHRARRITAYLNLMDRLVEKETNELRTSPFEPGSEITRYFEILPDCPRNHFTSRCWKRTMSARYCGSRRRCAARLFPGV